MDIKECTKCGATFTPNDYMKHHVRKDGVQCYNARCRACQNAQSRSWRHRNPEKMAARATQRRIDNAVWLKAHPDYNANRGLLGKLKKVKLTMTEYEAILAAQSGLCAICGNPETSPRYKRLTIDHIPDTNIFRGLLCHRCNVGLGFFDEQSTRLLAASIYLKKGDHHSNPVL